MHTLSRLIAAAVQACDPPTVIALKDRLGVSRQTIYDWRSGESTITDEHLSRLIEIANADPAEALTVHSESAKSAHERAMWRTLARRLGAAATLAAVALIPFAAHASTVTEQSDGLGIMRNRNRFRSGRFFRLFGANDNGPVAGTMRAHGQTPLLA